MILIVEHDNSFSFGEDGINEGSVIAVFSDPQKAERFLRDYKEEFEDFDGPGDGAMMVKLPENMDFSRYPFEPSVKDLYPV